MISATIDRPKLEKSLKKAAKGFGETTKQAVIRWGVSTCRTLAVQTQVWGGPKGNGPSLGSKPRAGKEVRLAQEGAMIQDALKVIYTRKTVGPKNKAGLHSPEAVNDWIEINRTGRNGRTPKNPLPISERKVCTPAVFKAAMKTRLKRAGMAKGGWLGAGQAIAAKQSGMDRINVGKNFLSYAQKHGSKGSARAGTDLFKPIAELHNGWSHSASKHVLSARAKDEAIFWGLKKTLSWYRRTAKAALDKA